MIMRTHPLNKERGTDSQTIDAQARTSELGLNANQHGAAKHGAMSQQYTADEGARRAAATSKLWSLHNSVLASYAPASAVAVEQLLSVASPEVPLRLLN